MISFIDSRTEVTIHFEKQENGKVRVIMDDMVYQKEILLGKGKVKELIKHLLDDDELLVIRKGSNKN